MRNPGNVGTTQRIISQRARVERECATTPRGVLLWDSPLAGRSVLQRALLIARTEQLRAYRTASLANYRASGVLSGYRRLVAKSARTCLACLLADGEFFTLDVAFEEHPAGRCTMVPVLASGEAPAWETGRTWFERQPEATQRRVIGPAAFEAWRAGAVGLDDLVERHEHPVWGGALVVRSLKKAIGEGEAKRWVRAVEQRQAAIDGQQWVRRELISVDVERQVTQFLQVRELPQLEYHFDAHGDDMGCRTVEEYRARFDVAIRRPYQEVFVSRQSASRPVLVWRVVDVVSGEVIQFSQATGRGV